MKINTTNFFLMISVLVSLGGCETIPESLPLQKRMFKPEMVMMVRQGMASEKVLEMFGEPKSVKQAVCGASTGHAWNCTTWEYGELSSDRASFTFDSGSESMVLNNFEIHGAGNELPGSFTTANVMRVRQGIGSEEIVRMFGLPRSVREAVCGSATGSPWVCTTWEYGDFSSDRASFTFSTKYASLVLNNFDVQRK